jgi:hypothetical protein
MVSISGPVMPSSAEPVTMMSPAASRTTLNAWPGLWPWTHASVTAARNWLSEAGQHRAVPSQQQGQAKPGRYGK